MSRLTDIVRATSTEQFGAILQLQQPLNEDDDAKVRERRRLIDTLCNELGCSPKELAAFYPLLQLREFMEMLAQLDESTLMDVRGVLPLTAREQQRHVVVQLQAFFQQMQLPVMRKIKQALMDVPPSKLREKLRAVLVLRDEFFFLYEPLVTIFLLDIDVAERIALFLQSLKPVQILQLVALRNMEEFDVLSLYSALNHDINLRTPNSVTRAAALDDDDNSNNNASTSTSSTATTATAAAVRSQQRVPKQQQQPPPPAAPLASSSSSSTATTARPGGGGASSSRAHTFTLSIVEQPGEMCVSRRNVRPHPMVPFLRL
jgi:hypothetical protein